MENKGCLTAYENCDDSWVVTTEGPRGPNCTESARALIGRSASSRRERESSRALEYKHVGLEYEHVGSAEEYVDSEDTSTWALQKSGARLKKGSA